MKKVTFLILLGCFLSASCNAQRAIVKLSKHEVKVSSTTFKLTKSSIKLTKVINSNNKLTNVKQVAPNLPSDIKMPPLAQVLVPRYEP